MELVHEDSDYRYLILTEYLKFYKFYNDHPIGFSQIQRQ